MNKIFKLKGIQCLFSFLKEIEYIENNASGCVIISKNETIKSTYRALYIVNEICKCYITTYEGYTEAIKSMFSFKYKIPICLSKKVIMIATKASVHYETVWINYQQVQTYEALKGGYIKILFKSRHVKVVKMSMNSFLMQIKRIETILFYKSKTLSYD